MKTIIYSKLSSPMSRTMALLMLLLYGMSLSAQGPNGSGTYYSSADGKSGEALKNALYNIIKNPSVTSYDGLKEAYKKTDMRADGKVRDWYSNVTNYTWSDFGGNQKEGAGWNREHSVPQSWFGDGKMKSDIVHVVPTDCYVNAQRGNYPFGEVGSAGWSSANGYSKLGTARSGLGYQGKVFEPNDEVKGDIARIYFYMATCYQDQCYSWGNSVFTGNSYQPLSQWSFEMFRRWAKEDPVDEVEKARNNAVFQVQKNRNPFVDYPGLEDFVWGEMKDATFSYTDYEGAADFVSAPVFSPSSGVFTDFVEVSISTATPDAAIYYTTDGSDATEQSIAYVSPVTLTSTTTFKAIAIKGDVRSSQSTATFTVRSSGDEDGGNGELALNNTFFNTPLAGSLQKSDSEDLIGDQGSVVVVYALGTGSYRYINDSHLRLYGGNTLTFSTTAGRFSQIAFELVESSAKTLRASVGTVDGLTWTGDHSQVVFSVDEGSGHLKMKKAVYTLSGTDALRLPSEESKPGIFFDLQGRKVKNPRPGLYVSNGRKYIVR